MNYENLTLTNRDIIIKKHIAKTLTNEEVALLEDFSEKISNYEVNNPNSDLSPMMDTIGEMITIILELKKEQ